PAAIVLCTSASDVSEALGFAARSGAKVVTRSGGHCFAGRSAGDGIVIDVSPIRSVTVSSGIVTVGAGARLGDVYDALAGEGVTIPGGLLSVGGHFGAHAGRRARDPRSSARPDLRPSARRADRSRRRPSPRMRRSPRPRFVLGIARWWCWQLWRGDRAPV